VTFTDDDLKRLKKLVESSCIYDADGVQIDTDFEALLARLEAGDYIAQVLERQERKGYLHSDLIEPLDAWRIASGRAEGERK